MDDDDLENALAKIALKIEELKKEAGSQKRRIESLEIESKKLASSLTDLESDLIIYRCYDD